MIARSRTLQLSWPEWLKQVVKRTELLFLLQFLGRWVQLTQWFLSNLILQWEMESLLDIRKWVEPSHTLRGSAVNEGEGLKTHCYSCQLILLQNGKLRALEKSMDLCILKNSWPVWKSSKSFLVHHGRRWMVSCFCWTMKWELIGITSPPKYILPIRTDHFSILPCIFPYVIMQFTWLHPHVWKCSSWFHWWWYSIQVWINSTSYLLGRLFPFYWLPELIPAKNCLSIFGLHWWVLDLWCNPLPLTSLELVTYFTFQVSPMISGGWVWQRPPLISPQ